VFSRQDHRKGLDKHKMYRSTKGNINSKRLNAPISSGRMAPTCYSDTTKEKQKINDALRGILGILRALSKRAPSERHKRIQFDLPGSPPSDPFQASNHLLPMCCKACEDHGEEQGNG
jgi:hypothetical protein